MGFTRRGYKRRRVADDDGDPVFELADGAAPYVTWSAMDDATLESEAASYAAVANKWAVAIAPSIDMQMRPHGQEEPSSSLWFSAIRASTDMQCAHALLSEYRNKEIKGNTSLDDLEASIRRWLPSSMRTPRNGPFLPTSLFLIVHGTPGHVVMGGYPIPVLDLLESIVSWLPEDDRRRLQHVHFDSCKALQGLFDYEKAKRASIRHITVTGFKVNTAVDSAQLLGVQFMRCVSNVIEATDADRWQQHGLTAVLLRQAKVRLQERIGKPPKGGTSDADAVVTDERSLAEDLTIL